MKRPIVLAGLMLFTPLASSSGFDFAALQSLITINHIRSIEAVLPALPDSLRYRYALVVASRSLQDAGYDGPRVILFGPDARLVVTFNGDRDQRGYDALETMEFDAASGQFRFREVKFPTHPADASPVTFSEPNPSRCQRCHGTPARPVWDTQPLWPGAYGERYQASLSAEEQAGMASFLARQAADPRYQSLLGVDRFANPETFRPSARNRYAGTPPEPPNAELSAHLESLVARSIAVEQPRPYPADGSSSRRATSCGRYRSRTDGLYGVNAGPDNPPDSGPYPPIPMGEFVCGRRRCPGRCREILVELGPRNGMATSSASLL